MERKWRLVSCHRAVRQARIIHGSRTGEAVTCEETRNPVHPALQILYLSRFLSESASRCPPLQAAAFHARVDSLVSKRRGAKVEHLNDSYLFVFEDSAMIHCSCTFPSSKTTVLFRCRTTYCFSLLSGEARPRSDLPRARPPFLLLQTTAFR